eukprot:COSAG02_NODE_547_length_20492_cov_265.508802_18_plen_121_part_00
MQGKAGHTPRHTRTCTGTHAQTATTSIVRARVCVCVCLRDAPSLPLSLSPSFPLSSLSVCVASVASVVSYVALCSDRLVPSLSPFPLLTHSPKPLCPSTPTATPTIITARSRIIPTQPYV